MTHYHPTHGEVSIEKLLPGGWAWVLRVDDKAVKVRLDTLTAGLELEAA